MTMLRVTQNDHRPLLTPKALAAKLSISERTSRQMIADGRIASYRIEGCRRVDVADLDAYLQRNRTERA